jgi:hypothetical protein
VRAKRIPDVDWRDAAAYAPLLRADRSLLAWEWLRRDDRYVEAAMAALSDGPPPACSGAARFGLAAFEAPDRAVPHARPVWSSQAHPYVLSVEPARPCGAADAFDLACFAGSRPSPAGNAIIACCSADRRLSGSNVNVKQYGCPTAPAVALRRPSHM